MISKPMKSSGFTLEYRVYFALSFVLFLPAVLLGRLGPRSVFGRGVNQKVSIIAETRALTNQVVPFFFMK